MATSACDRLRAHLVDYVVGEEDPTDARRREIDEHLAVCSECRMIAEELRGTGRALEAIKVMDTQLRDDIRKKITTRARAEAAKIRATREEERVGHIAALRRPVSPLAWAVLVLGVAAVFALAAAAPGLLREASAGKVRSAQGAGFRDQWSAGQELQHGQQISVPDGAFLCLDLGGGCALDLCGPCEVTLAAGDEPLRLLSGRAWVAADSATRVAIDPLKNLELSAGSKVALHARTVDDPAALVAVVAGEVSYSASGGSGHAKVQETLVVDRKSAKAEVRPSQESERAPWRNRLKR